MERIKLLRFRLKFGLNKSAANGAGMYNDNGAAPLLINCLFCGNWSMLDGAGIYNNADSNAVLVNCTVSANKALGDGGGVYCNNSDPILDNCILWSNIDDVNNTNESAQIYSDGGNPAINYSCIQGWTSGGNGNTANDPNFVEEGYWDWRQSDGNDFTINETFEVDPCKVTIYDFKNQHSDFNKQKSHIRNHFILSMLGSDLSNPTYQEGYPSTRSRYGTQVRVIHPPLRPKRSSGSGTKAMLMTR